MTVNFCKFGVTVTAFLSNIRHFLSDFTKRSCNSIRFQLVLTLKINV